MTIAAECEKIEGMLAYYNGLSARQWGEDDDAGQPDGSKARAIAQLEAELGRLNGISLALHGTFGLRGFPKSVFAINLVKSYGNQLVVDIVQPNGRRDNFSRGTEQELCSQVVPLPR
jgi:hypothetical protein